MKFQRPPVRVATLVQPRLLARLAVQPSVAVGQFDVAVTYEPIGAVDDGVAAVQR